MPFAAEFFEAAAIVAAILLNIVGWCVALGLLYTWNATFHYIFAGIARFLRISTPLGSINLGGWAHTIDHAAQSWLSAWALGNEIMIGKLWHALGWSWSQLTGEVAAVSGDLSRFAHWITNVHTPALIQHWVAYLQRQLNRDYTAANARAGQAASAARKAQHDAHHAAQQAGTAATQAKQAAKTAHHPGAVATTTAGAVPHVGSHVTTVPAATDLTAPIGRTIRDLKRLARKHEGLFAASVMAGVMANVLGLPNWRCLTRGNIGRLSRHICGLSTRALNDLLGLIADAVILANICHVFTLLEEGLGFIEPEITAFITATETWLCYGDSEAPPETAAPDLLLPSFRPIALSLP